MNVPPELAHALSDHPDWQLVGVLADWYEEGGSEAMSYALRWCAARHLWPGRVHYLRGQVPHGMAYAWAVGGNFRHDGLAPLCCRLPLAVFCPLAASRGRYFPVHNRITFPSVESAVTALVVAVAVLRQCISLRNDSGRDDDKVHSDCVG